MIYYDLAEDTAQLLNTDEYAWQVVSGAVLTSNDGFPDTTIIEGLWLQDKHCASGASLFDDTNSRSYVAFGVVRGREECVESDPLHTITIFYRDQKCRDGRNAFGEYTRQRPSEFMPRCIVILLEAVSRADLRDELVEAGRLLLYPLRISLNYTTALSPAPDLTISSDNCALGDLYEQLYDADLAQQRERDALARAQNELANVTRQRNVFTRYLDARSAFMPPFAPPSPAPPRAPDAPQVPLAVPFEVRLQQLDARVQELELEVRTRDASIKLCVPSPTHTCGRSSTLAPNPWISLEGPCFGNATREALEGAFCAYWGSPRNVYASESGEAAEMLTAEGAPYCFGEDGRALRCAPTADRTHRAGVYELREQRRIDRPYCTSDMFKRLSMDNESISEAKCRQTLLEREQACQLSVCRQCISPCLYPTLKTIGSLAKCANPIRHFGFLHYAHTSDAGQLARSMHGARRQDNYGPVPEKFAAHLYNIAHKNSQKGYLQRDSVSCRKEHRRSPMAHFAPGFDTDGKPAARTGYMVACLHHADCMPCGRHPLTGQHYRCQKIYTLYDTVYTPDEGGIAFINVTSGASNAFDIDLEEGAINGKTGICVDLDSSMNEQCTSPAGALVKDATIGCFDYYASKWLCGLSVDVKHGDLSTVHTSGNLFWPRVLVEGNGAEDADGNAIGELTCGDPIDCIQKCRLLERSSLNGAGAPPTCALCAATHSNCCHVVCSTTTPRYRQMHFPSTNRFRTMHTAM